MCVSSTLNYDEHMVCYQFRTRPNLGGTHIEWMAKTKDNSKRWIELLVAEERRQLHITDRALWPPSLPWMVRKMYGMPIVLWMSTAKQ